LVAFPTTSNLDTSSSIPIITPCVDWSNCVKVPFAPIDINVSVPSADADIVLAPEPNVINDVEPPFSKTLPSPNDIDAWVDDISKLLASNSKVSEAKSIPVPLNFICPPLPTAENNGVEPPATASIIPVSP